nr:retrotransposon Orf1 [Tanacetum cinerariifolium]
MIYVGIKRLLSVVEVATAGYGFYYRSPWSIKGDHRFCVKDNKKHEKNTKASRLRDNALVEYIKKLKKAEKERDELKLALEKFQNSSKSFNNLLESQDNVKSISDKGYHAFPLPYTRNYIPPKPDLIFIDEHVENESVDVVFNVTSSAVKTVESVDVKNKGVYSTVETKPIKKNSFSPLIIKDWNSDDESEVEFKPKVKVKTVRHCIEKIKFVKTANEKVEKVETPKQHKHYPRGIQRNWNNLIYQRQGSNFKMINKACYVCGSFEHLQYNCDKRVVRPVWNNSRRDRLKLKELMELSTKLSDRVLDLERIKTTQAKEIADLKKRVKKLERKRRSRTPKMNLFKISTSRRRSLDYELAARLRAEEQRRKPLTKAQKKNQI